MEQYLTLFSSWSEQAHGAPAAVVSSNQDDLGWKFQTHSEEVVQGATHLQSAVQFLLQIWALLVEWPPVANDQRLIWSAELNQIIEEMGVEQSQGIFYDFGVK